jgi:gas vesicle protein
MSAEQPTWEERVQAVRSRYNTLRNKIGMDDVTRRLGDVATEIAGLPSEIKGLRDRGYAFAGYLERKADVLNTQWDEVRHQVQRMASQEIERVQRQFEELTDMLKRLESQVTDRGKEQNLRLFSMSLETLEKAVDTARSRIEGLYGQVPENVSQTTSQIKTIQKYLAMADESTIKWGPTEALFMVHEGEWRKTGKGKEDPDGLIFVTDQRLIFEQKEKVGGRFGFGGDKVQQVVFETPIGAISEVGSEDKGLFGQKDLIHLKLSSGDYPEVTFEVKSGGIDSKWYMQQLNRVISGEIDKERAIPVDEAAVQALREAPTTCSTCGATLPPITRGQTEVTCEYCGTVVRI